MKFLLAVFLFLVSYSTSFSQHNSQLPANEWVDSVFKKLSRKQKIAQLMIIRAHSNLGEEHIKQVTELVKKFNVGGLCFFQGGPERQANLTNFYQSIAKTPLMVTIDGEWGLGMRLDSIISFQRQMMIGAVSDAQLFYRFGRAVGEQCKRMGIHVNFAPVVDINNNPDNPVINDRSFGEDKYKVALFGTQYMKGMQDVGIMACAKHFPGHGDVSVDSHLDLPIINKSRAQLDSLELYPFRQMIKEGVGSIMSAHLYIPVIDTISNQATSLSYKTVTGLLRNELGFKGLTFTDALEMKGVSKYYPAGQASAQSLIAGNDMLCLPEDIKGSIKKIRKAIRKHQIEKADFEARVKKVLLAKYHLGLNNQSPIQTGNIVNEVNANTNEIKTLIAQKAITLLKLSNKEVLPLKAGRKIAFVGVGIDKANAFANRIQKDYRADLFTFGYKEDSLASIALISKLKGTYDLVVIGVHNYSRRPANRYGISPAAYNLVNQLQSQNATVTFVFGNPYAMKSMAPGAANLVACYEDDEITQQAAADVLTGKISPKGKLPVTVSEELHYGMGITESNYFPHVTPETVGLKSEVLNRIDSIATDAIANHATPGCVVLVAKDGKVAFQRAYGYTNYDSIEPVNNDMIYDLASVTKISATTVSVMKLYEEGKLDLDKTLGDYLPWVRGSNKEKLVLRNLLLHQAGLVSFIPFYKDTNDKNGNPLPRYYSKVPTDTFSIRVADSVYMRRDYQDTMYSRILTSKLSPSNEYIYSDNDFIFMGKVVEAVTGKPLQEYVRETFYDPLQMTTTSFKPREYFPVNMIAPTEYDKTWRQQLLRGDVHDPGAAMFGGVAGHAGLFSNAYDLAKLYQMLLNGGEMEGVRYLKKETIDKFTAYSSNISRRGIGFDKPEKDNATRKVPYPAKSVSPATFGHTGYTGTCVWADPKQNLLYIFLSNRVTPVDTNKLLQMNVRGNIHEVIYAALQKGNAKL
ncbi:glycoside hydrolase family 3 N-terminal domain-containing protein [Segetibacter aerophilus]|uniref:beta-N-acetylhexosaminidase n=1 Tax=Segetibacter aerophilus TaxID=670293 RepID=A0A512BJB4_9BACT|nr:glycoside hydrolase family 3 N-terminal domain-containing protein [Segetibacter aerophilus]GEO12061.1 beta-N-acetylglucosaminidase [Segetibacter aerophilus]